VRTIADDGRGLDRARILERAAAMRREITAGRCFLA
jgi:chemotaxis protein histidine kinase CheA